MRIVPAIDLKSGSVVRAVAGHREHYRPIDSRLAKDAQPESVGRALVDKLDLRQAYVADLDAIAGAVPAWETFVGLIRCGLSLWIDAGITDMQRVERLVEFAADHPEVNGIILGLETLPDQNLLREAIGLVGAERFIFGLDLRDGRPLTEAADFGEMIAPEIAAVAVHFGARRLMVIDLANVGMHGGCDATRLCRVLHRRFPEVELIAGGGIRDADDLERLAHNDCHTALVSSALHDGWITPEQLADYTE